MKFKIRTNLATGILFGIINIILVLLVPSQIAVPKYSNGGPSPRIIPYMVLGGMLICCAGLIIQSLIFKKDDVVEYEFKLEKPALIMIALMIVFGVLMVKVSFTIAIIVVLPLMLFFYGERKIPVYVLTILAGIGVYFLFLKVFNISLPSLGILGIL